LAIYRRQNDKRHLQRFDTTPFLAEQRAAFDQCDLDWEKSLYAVNRFFDSRNEIRRDTSQHWEVAAGVVLAGGVKRVLEIGTERGQFTAFLHSLDSRLQVTTVDLPSDNKRYITATTAARGDVENELSAIQSTVTERSRNINHLERVRFWEMNSVRLALVEEKFDFIFVDGDHTYPVVAIDAINAIRLVQPNGWVLFDDLISEQRVASEYGGAESTRIVNVLEESGVASVTRFHKRLEALKLVNEVDRKYIALARRNVTAP
jgi:predicted O-methyltransferase YrrM